MLTYHLPLRVLLLPEGGEVRHYRLLIQFISKIRKEQTENNRVFGLIHVNDCDMHCGLS